MYRVIKKTNSRTQYKCLKCQYVKLKTKKEHWGCMGECTAPNRAIKEDFNLKDYYCLEYKGFSDLTPYQRQNIKEQIIKNLEDSAFKEYVKNYYCKQDVSKMIYERRNHK